MPSSFTEWLVLVLVTLLFGEKTLWPVMREFFGKKFGLNNGNGEEKRYKQQEQIDDLEKHAAIANEEMGQIVERLGVVDGRLGNIERDVAFIRGQLSTK